MRDFAVRPTSRLKPPSGSWMSSLTLLVFASGFGFGCGSQRRAESNTQTTTTETSEITTSSRSASSTETTTSHTEVEVATQPFDADALKLLLEAPKKLARDFHLNRMELTPGVVEREPMLLAGPFRAGDRAMVFFEFANLSNREHKLTVIWRAPEGHPPHEPIELTVPIGERHRTWAYSLPLVVAGRWVCELRNQRGLLLADLPFEAEQPQ